MHLAKLCRGGWNEKIYGQYYLPVGSESCSNPRLGADASTLHHSYDRRPDRRDSNRYDSRNYRNQGYSAGAYDNSGYRNDVYNNSAYQNNAYPYSGYSNGSVWQQHRDKITTAGGAVAGALLGGLAGGKRGAIIGAVAGGGAAALYTYKIRNRYRY